MNARGLERRLFLWRLGAGFGWLTAAELLGASRSPQSPPDVDAYSRGVVKAPDLPPKAKRVIYLHMLGAVSQVDTLDYKPTLVKMHGQQLPPSARGQRLSTMVAGQTSFPVVGPLASFKPGGQSGTMVSDLMPFLRNIVDDVCVMRAVHTDHVNHDPAAKFLHTGFQIAGRPSAGAWVNYALGSIDRDLPAFIVLTSGQVNGVPLDGNTWGAGFLPSQYQGVMFRSREHPVYYLDNPTGTTTADRNALLDVVKDLSALQMESDGDPDIASRIADYEMSERMQRSVPEIANLNDEPDHVLEMYGPDVHQPGSFARNCLLARRLAERDVRYTMIVQMGWDHHTGIVQGHPAACRAVDRPAAALVRDLKQRGMLDDTLVVFATEFGRTSFAQGDLKGDFGRDHHGDCFSMWMAGGGVRGGVAYGETDEFCGQIVKDPVHIHDLNATILRTLGLDHERLTFRTQGRDFRLTDVSGRVVTDILS